MVWRAQNWGGTKRVKGEGLSQTSLPFFKCFHGKSRVMLLVLAHLVFCFSLGALCRAESHSTWLLSPQESTWNRLPNELSPSKVTETIKAIGDRSFAHLGRLTSILISCVFSIPPPPIRRWRKIVCKNNVGFNYNENRKILSDSTHSVLNWPYYEQLLKNFSG